MWPGNWKVYQILQENSQGNSANRSVRGQEGDNKGTRRRLEGDRKGTRRRLEGDRKGDKKGTRRRLKGDWKGTGRGH